MMQRWWFLVKVDVIHFKSWWWCSHSSAMLYHSLYQALPVIKLHSIMSCKYIKKLGTLVRLCCPGNPYKNKGQLRDPWKTRERMTTWIKRQNVWVGCKVMKLLQEKQLLARVFVIQYLFKLDLGMLIEANEMSTILFSHFCNDGCSSLPARLLLLNSFKVFQVIPKRSNGFKIIFMQVTPNNEAQLFGFS